MTDITDDIAEEISFQGFEDDCRLLGNLLNDVLQRELGPDFMDKLERTRVLAQVSATYLSSHLLFVDRALFYAFMRFNRFFFFALFCCCFF